MSEESVIESLPAAVEAPKSIPLKLVPFICRCIGKTPGVMVKFVADAKTGHCPCGLEISDPRNIGILFKSEIIHLEAPTGFIGRGKGFAVCDSSIKSPGPEGVMFTGEAHACTCPGCKSTDIYADMIEKSGTPSVPNAADVELSEWKPPATK